MAAPVVRLTANLTPEVADKLEDLATQMGTTKTQALNQAISAMAELYSSTSDGGEVVVKKGNNIRGVSLPRSSK